MLTPRPKHTPPMRCSFASAEAVLLAECLMDGCEEVERAVNLCAREIELLSYRMKQKSLHAFPADRVYKIPTQQMADVPLRNRPHGGCLLAHIQVGSRRFMHPPAAEYLRYVRYWKPKSHPGHQIVIFGKPILGVGRVSADFLDITTPRHDGRVKKRTTP